MSGTSSASPENLEVFVKTAGAATDRLDHAVSGAAGVVNGFYDAPCDPRFRPAGGADAFGQAQTLVRDNEDTERWIGGIRHAFIQADTNTLPDAVIAAGLARQHINPTAPPGMTADEPVYTGATMFSGWTDDPVSTGGGHFLEVETDLRMPAALSTLGWTRVYGSRFVGPGAHGAGWHSWADTRLEVGEAAVVYHGPDGQVAPFARSGEGWVSHPAMEADLAAAGGGFELRWRWTGRYPGMTWHFDGEGRLRRIDDPAGGSTEVERAGDRLVALVHQGGRRLEVDWDGDRIAGIASSDGRSVRYRYDGAHLSEVDRPEGWRRYTTGADGRIAEVFDADGVRLVANTYDSDGRVLSQTSPRGRIARYRYSAPLTVVVSDDEGGPPALFHHDHAGRIVELQLADGSRSTRRFDAAGNPVEVVGFDGSVTRRRFDSRGYCVAASSTGECERTWEYDDLGRVAVMSDSLGGRYELHYDDGGPLPARIDGPLGAVTHLEHAGGLLSRIVDPDGVETRLERDGDGQVVALSDGAGGVTRYEYHPSGQVRSVTSPTGDTSRWEYDGGDRAVAAVDPGGATFQRRYSPAGRLLAEVDPGGAVTRYEYDGAGDLCAVVRPDGGRQEIDRDVNGRVSALAEPDGSVWRQSWDALGRLERLVEPSGAEWGMEWRAPDTLVATVDPLGHVRRFDLAAGPDGRLLSASTPSGRSYELRWDGAGRPAGGSSDGGATTFELRYDAAGRPVEWLVDGAPAGRATFTPAGRLASLSRPDGALWTWSYDQAGRVLEVAAPEGDQHVEYDRAGRPVRLRSAGGPDCEIEWDGCGRMVEARVGDVAVRRSYDPAGGLVEEIDPLGGRRRWERDAAGRVIAAVDQLGASSILRRDHAGEIVAATGAEGEEWAYRRDALGRVVAIADPLGREQRFEYDPAGRATRAELPDGTAREYRWDADGNLVGIDAVDAGGSRRSLLGVDHDWPGRTTTLTGADGRRVSFRTDGHDRPVDIDGGDGAGHLDWSQPGAVTLTRPDGTEITTELAPGGLPVRMIHPAIGPVEMERDRAGRLLSVRAAGLQRTWRRDANGDAVAYREERDGCVSETVLERDPAGRIAAVSVDGARTTYSYDAAGQLVGCGGDGGEWAWSYDAAGRLVAEVSPSGGRRLAYDAADQLVRSEAADGSVTEIRHDELGRRIEEKGPRHSVRYHWDEADRLVAVERTVDGRSSTTTISYDPLGRVVAVGGTRLRWDGAGALGWSPTRIGDREVVQLPGVPLAEVDAGGVRWLPADWRGSVGRRLAWGEPVAGDGRPVHPEVGFLGEMEVEGLVWLRARWYDPSTHTFLSRDPQAGSLVAAGGGTNPYLYAHNDPLGWVDPTGLRPVTAHDAAAQMQQWRQGHMELVVTVVAAIAVGVTAVVAPELIVPMLFGFAGGSGGTLLGDLVHGKSIDWTEVAMNGFVGSLIGAGGGVLGGATKLMEPVAGIGGRALGVGYGAVAGGGATALDRWATGAPFSATDTAIGAGFGGVFGAGALHADDDIPWQKVAKLTPKQLARAQSDGLDARLYGPRVSAAKAAVDKLNAAARTTNIRRDAGVGAVGAVGAGAATPGDPTDSPQLPASRTYYPAVPAPAIPALL